MWVAGGMEVDVDAPDEIVHVRRDVVLTMVAANDGALWPGGGAADWSKIAALEDAKSPREAGLGPGGR